MFRNMIHRKSLAIGAALSLVITGLAASPAKAENILLTQPDLGVSLNGVISTDGTSDVFVLKTTMSPALNGGDETTLNYRIQNPTGAEIFITATNDGDPANLAVQAAGELFDYGKGAVASTLEAGNASTKETDIAVEPAAADVGEATADNLLGIAVDSATVKTEITVTAWLNQVNAAGDAIDGVETVAASVTITFYPETDLTWSVKTYNPIPGDSTVTAVASVSPAINGNYFDGTVTADHTRQGSTAELAETLTWDNVNKHWDGSGLKLGVGLANSLEWAGMPNVDGMATHGSEGAGSAAATFSIDRGADYLVTGDVVRINSSTATNDIARAEITGFAGTTYKYTRATGEDVPLAADTGHLTVIERQLTNSKVVAGSLKVAEFTTGAPHGLSVGDTITIDSDRAAELDSTTAIAVTKVPSSTTFQVTYAAAKTAADAADTGEISYVSFFEVVAGTYTTQIQVDGVDASTKATNGTIAAASASTEISTVQSASVQNAIDSNSDGTYDDTLVKAGTLSVPVTATILDADGDAVGSGRPVQVTSITAVGTTEVNGTTTAGEILTTDANGQVTVTVTSDTGASTEKMTVTLTPEGVSAAAATFVLDWEAQSYALYDLASTSSSALATAGDPDLTLTIVKGGSYTMNLAVLDQWYQAPADGTYRIKVTGGGVDDGFITLTGGKANLTIADNGIGTSYDTQIDLQKLTAGVFADVAANPTDVTTNVDAAKILVAADGSQLYSAETADLANTVSLKALLELDKRQENGVTPAYSNNVLVTGQIVDASTLAGLAGAPVTISGPSNILFENGAVASRGSLTFLSESDGDFSVKLYSTTAQTASTITITSLGVSNTVSVTFSGQTAGEGTVLTIVAPSFVSAASSFQATVNLSDELGNGVSTGTDGTIKITRTGPGIAFGTLPTDTDANGNASFSVLLGANDSGTITITASYDQNDDGDYTDAKDLTVTKIVTIGAAPVAKKVNAGSFKGYVAIYARGYEGQRLSAKVGNDWVIVDPIVNNQGDDLHRTVEFTGAGVAIAVRIYIDRVLVDTINLTTK